MKKLIFLIAVFTVEVLGAVLQSTGVMVNSQPLVSTGSSHLHFDLDLWYSSGITVNQRASWVGLGFDISIPYIDRIPVGSVDEKAGSVNCRVGPGFYPTKNFSRVVSVKAMSYDATGLPKQSA